MLDSPTRVRSPRRMLRTVIPVVAMGAALATVLAGCSGSSGSAGGSGGTPTVTVWSWDSGAKAVFEQAAKDLAAQGTKMNINYRSIVPTSYDSVLQTAMNGGQGPDVMFQRAGEGTKTYAAAGLIAPLDGIVDKSGFSQAELDTATYKGKVYGVPDAIQTMEVFYNKDVLAKNHLNPPTDWSSFMADLKALKAAGVTPMTVMGVQQWMLALEIDAVAASTMPSSYIQAVQDKTAKYTDQPYVQTLAAFQKFAPYLEKGWEAVGSADDEQEVALALGKTGFIIDGIFDVDTIQKTNPNVKLGQFIMPSPNGQQPKIDWYPDSNFSLNAAIKDPAVKKAAQKLMQFTSTKEFGNLWAEKMGSISPIAGTQMPASQPFGLQAAQWFEKQPINPLWGIRSAMDTPDPSGTHYSSGKVETTNSLQGIFEAEQKIAVPLLQGKLTPEQAAAEVQKAQSWYYAK